MRDNDDSCLVYSSATGRICPKCQQPVKKCRCKKQSLAPVGDGIVRISRETKGRKGKGVTIISGIPLADVELKNYVKKLKKQCGSGGTIKGGIVEIQGDHREVLLPILQQSGWQVKRSGG